MTKQKHNDHTAPQHGDDSTVMIAPTGTYLRQQPTAQQRVHHATPDHTHDHWVMGAPVT